MGRKPGEAPGSRDRKPTHSEFDAPIMGVLPPFASVARLVFSGSRNIGPQAQHSKKLPAYCTAGQASREQPSGSCREVKL